MTVSENILRDHVERSFNLLPPVPGLLQHLDIPGVQGRVTSISHPLANLVCAARLREDNCEEAIDRVMSVFAERDLAFGWAVGPCTTPPDLGERLEAHGLVLDSEMAALAQMDLRAPILVNPEVEVREVRGDETVDLEPLVAESFGLPQKVGSLFFKALRSGSIVSRVYCASLDGKDVSWGISTYVPDDPIVQLAGAATLAEFRGRGIYTSLVARRLRDAARDGMEAAIIQAVQTTSAPICRKLGFMDLGELHFYVHKSTR